MTEKEDQQKSSPLVNALTKETPSLITSFSIFGIRHTTNPTTPNPKTEILFKYPESFNFPLNSEKFIAPKGCTIMQDVPNDQLKEPLMKYVTMLPSENDSTICVCLAQRELLALCSDLIEPMKLDRTVLQNKYYTDRVYCFTTTCPYINALLPMLQKLVECDNNRKLKFILSNGEISYSSSRSISEAMLQTMLKIPQPKENTISMKYDDGTYEYLRSSQKFSYTPLSRNILLLADYSLIRLFTCMSIDNILNCLSVMLMGVGVILISDDISNVTACVHGLMTLFQPFCWQGIYIPYIPDELYEMYEAPVPILCGGKLPPTKCCVDSYVFDLDQSYFSFFFSKLDKMFSYYQPESFIVPWRGALSEKLSRVVREFIPERLTGKACEEFCKKLSQEQIIKFSTRVMSIFNDVLYRNLENLITNERVKIPNYTLEMFMEKFPMKYELSGRLFMEKFVHSQHFNVWWYENGLDKIKVVGTHSPRYSFILN